MYIDKCEVGKIYLFDFESSHKSYRLCVKSTKSPCGKVMVGLEDCVVNNHGERGSTARYTEVCDYPTFRRNEK